MTLRARRVLVVATSGLLTAVLLGASGGRAAGHPLAALRAQAADPIVGSWLFTSRRGDLSATPAASIVASGTGFDIVTNAGWKSSGPGCITFSVAERASAYSDYPECTITSGTVIGHFTFTGTDGRGIRRYQGAMLKATGGSVCTLIGLQGTYYAQLVRWSDDTLKPPLADGPYNRFCIHDDPGDGCYVTFDRKGGTAPASGGGTTTTPALAKTKAPASGLVPRNPKIPPDKRFKNDHTPPTVKAVASHGSPGAAFFLDYYAKDDRGFAGEMYRIYSGKTLVKAWGILAGERDGRLQHGPARLSASISGSLTFCVGAQDLNGNRSKWSCAPLTIS